MDCEKCAETPKLKETLGCDGPPRMANGQTTTWKYPPDDPLVELTRCPLKMITLDIWDILGAAYLADNKLTLTEQDTLPVPYIQAWTMIAGHRQRRQSYEIKQARR